MGLKNPGVFVYLGLSETITPQIPRYNCFFVVFFFKKRVLDLFILLYFMYAGVLSACVYVYHVSARCPWSLEEGH